ncbi:MAG: TIR domain-containing protein [Alphaproteobacteria bacterium]|jgi:tetratricopeptide (TPR) repeat protein|nr:TIR domain-containing protein [Alphaproteobacteria bacterium]
MDSQDRKGLRAFISYAHEDEEHAERLERHLAPLRRQGLISAWRDRTMLPGAQVAEEIDAAIDASDLVLLLTSADSLASDWCVYEAGRGLARAQVGKARVVPIILDSCDWQASPFGALGALPTDGVPVADWGRPAKAFDNVTAGLRRICQEALGPDLDADQAAGAVPAEPEVGPDAGPQEGPDEKPEQQTPASVAPADLGPNPYRGLDAFHEEDADRFFGRKKLTAALLKRFRALHAVPPAAETGPVRLLPIIGPSGSGKSSVARAGLLASLKKDPPDGLKEPAFAVLTPGERPLQELARTLADLALDDEAPVAKRREFEEHLAQPDRDGAYSGLDTLVRDSRRLQGRALVLLVDQFEEAYALCRKDQDRDAFIATLLHAAGVRDGRVSIILTLRSDFLGATNRDPALSRLLAEQGELVPVMDAAELDAAIARPAERAGHPIDPATVRLLVDQTEGREGALPLLQFVLTRIWEGMAEGTPPAETVKTLKGVGGALAAEAARLYDSLTEAQQRIARRAFLKMTRLGEGTRDTRRRAAIDEIVTGDTRPEDIQAVLDVFARKDYRIVTLSGEGPGERVAEVTHEALFDHWTALRAWLDDGRSDEQFDRKLAEAARDWDKAGRPRGSLWRRPNLDLLRDFHARRAGEMTDVQRAFFRESDALQKAQIAAEQRRIRRTRAVAAAMTALAIVAGGFGWYAYEKGVEADLNARQAEASARQAEASAEAARVASREALDENRRAETDRIWAEHMRTVADRQRAAAEQAQGRAEYQQQRAEAALAHAEEQRAAAERNINIATYAADALVRDLAGGLRNVSGIRAETVRRILERAEGVFESLFEAGAASPRLRRQHGWMHIEFGRTLATLGDTHGQLNRAEAAVAVLEDLVADDPDTLQWQRDLAVAFSEVGDARRALGDLPGAFAAYSDDLTTRDRLIEADPDNTGWQLDLSVAHERIGDVLRDQGDLGGALQSYRDSLAIRERLAAADPGNAQSQRDLSVSHDRIGDVQRVQGDLGGALQSYRDSLAIRERLAAADPGNAQWQRDLFISFIRIAMVEMARDNPAAALALYEEALPIAERLAALDETNVRAQEDLAWVRDRIAETRAMLAEE